MGTLKLPAGPLASATLSELGAILQPQASLLKTAALPTSQHLDRSLLRDPESQIQVHVALKIPEFDSLGLLTHRNCEVINVCCLNLLFISYKSITHALYHQHPWTSKSFGVQLPRSPPYLWPQRLKRSGPESWP